MEQSLQERGGRHRRWSLVGAVVAVVASLLVIVAEPNAGAAPIAPVPNTEITLAVAADGTASFSDPAFVAGDVGDHTPGYDAGANNGIVRTFDTVTYRVDWNANERAADEVELSMTLPAGVRWKRDTTGMVAPGCLDDAAGSSISADGRTWTCALGSKAQGTAGAIFPVAEVEQLGDGQLVAVHASLSTLQAGVVQSNDVTSIVSAAPSANWVKGNQSGKAASNGMKPYDPALAGPSTPPGPTQIDDVMRSGVPGRIFIYPIWLEPGDIGHKGSDRKSVV